jgi:hypothetical protein
MCAFNVSSPMPHGSPARRCRPGFGTAGLAYFQPVAASSRFSNMGIMLWT